jgi:hypothetical protein
MLQNGRRAASRTANVRFDPEEWRAVEQAATRAGVSVREYVRDAVLARTAVELAAGPSDGGDRAALARLNSAERRSEARALVAEAEQAVRHAHELADSWAATGDACCGNISYVGQLWRVFKHGGVLAVAELVPPDVIWRPLAANGRALHGTRELEEFWSSREVVMPSLTMFHGYGDDVLVSAEYGQEDGSARCVWLLYLFDGDRLLEAVGFEDESQARSYAGAVTKPAGKSR